MHLEIFGVLIENKGDFNLQYSKIILCKTRATCRISEYQKIKSMYAFVFSY